MTEPLFEAVREDVSYKPRTFYRMPGEDHQEDDYRRGPGRQATRGPEDAKTPDYWQQEAESVLFALLRARGEVTSDDLRAHYADEPSATSAAIGALFRRLSKRGRIVLDHHRPSSRKEARGRVVGVWRLP